MRPDAPAPPSTGPGSRLRRLGIAQQLSLLLAGAVLLAVVTVGGLSAWTLRSGFSDYLRLRDEEQMTQLAALVQTRVEASQGMTWLTSDRLAMRDLMDQLHGRPARRGVDDSPAPERADAPPRPERAAPRPRMREELDDHAQRPPPRTDRYGPPPRSGDDAGDDARRTPPRPDQYGPPPRPGEQRHAHGQPPPPRPGEGVDGYARRPPPPPDGYGPPPGPGEGPHDHAQRPPPARDGYGPPPRPSEEANEYAQRPTPRPPALASAPRPRQDARPPPPPSQGNPATLFDRVVITDAQGRWLAGRQPPGTDASRRPVQLNGVTLAYLALVPQPQPVGLDALFLQRQYTGLLVGAGLTVLLALLAAWWVARRWSRPLLALSQASRHIAAGERDIALAPAGAHEIAQLADDMNHMAQSLNRLEQARRLWIAQISHELRTPLAVLRGELEAIEDGARQPTPAVLASLREEVMQLNRLVDDLHTLSVADMDGMRCDFQDGDADALLRRVATRFAELAQQRGLRLTFPTTPAPLDACWDFQRIDQLLTNLLSNSLRYTHTPGEVHVQWHSAAGDLILTVEDTAPGVQPEDLAQLFEPLFRADKSRQRGTDHGSGLGLAIVRSIATAHQGEVSVQSSTLGGLRFTVRLPLQVPTAV